MRFIRDIINEKKQAADTTEVTYLPDARAQATGSPVSEESDAAEPQAEPLVLDASQVVSRPRSAPPGPAESLAEDQFADDQAASEMAAAEPDEAFLATEEVGFDLLEAGDDEGEDPEPVESLFTPDPEEAGDLLEAHALPLGQQEEDSPPGAAEADLAMPGFGRARTIVDIPEAAPEVAPVLAPVLESAMDSAGSVPSPVDVPTPAAGRASRRAGRVKTRLLGFGAAQDMVVDPLQSAAASPAAPNRLPVGWLAVTDGPGQGAVFTLFEGVSQIGRGEDQAVRLDFGDTSISRSNHAALAYDPEQRAFYLGHGGKANLVRLNDRPVLSTETIQSGDQIRLGETRLRFVALCGADFDWAGAAAQQAGRVHHA